MSGNTWKETTTKLKRNIIFLELNEMFIHIFKIIIIKKDHKDQKDKTIIPHP